MNHTPLWLGATSCALLCVASCQSPTPSDETAHEAEAQPTDEIFITPQQAAAAGIVVDTLRTGTFAEVLPATGQLLPSPGDETLLSAPATGIVHLAQPLTEGLAVAQGQELLSIATDQTAEGDAATKTRIDYEAARAAYERAGLLVGDQIISQREYEALRQQYEQARLAHEAYARRGGSRQAVRATAGGLVSRPLVGDGDYVTAGQPLAYLTRGSQVLLRVDVPAAHHASLANMRTANFRTTPDGTVHQLDSLGGRLLSIGQTAGEGSAYIPVTFAFEQPSPALPLGTFVEAWLLAGERTGVPTLPLSAITEEQGAWFVYVQMDADGYAKREVRLGTTDGRRVEVLGGLSVGEPVVVQGAYRVKLAGASSAIPAHTHEH